jgi:outer membrane protein OmpA-like peptidoglycan-associated protein
MSGQGACYDKTGKLICRGSFIDGRYVGSYSSTDSKDDTFRFQVISFDDDVYMGETKNGERHGRGIFLWSDGSMWYGPYKNDKQDGYGIVILPDGNVNTGIWGEPEPAIEVNQVVIEDISLSLADLAILPDPIFFDHGEYELTPEAIEILDSKVTIMEKYPDVKIVIAGNTDDLENDQVNIPLGQRRADAARDYLEKNGINASRMTTITQASNYPMLPNTNEQNRAKNNRCDFKILGY